MLGPQWLGFAPFSGFKISAYTYWGILRIRLQTRCQIHNILHTSCIHNLKIISCMFSILTFFFQWPVMLSMVWNFLLLEWSQLSKEYKRKHWNFRFQIRTGQRIIKPGLGPSACLSSLTTDFSPAWRWVTSEKVCSQHNLIFSLAHLKTYKKIW